MSEARRQRLIQLIEDVTMPRCKEPGCVFRTRVCPVHGHGDDEPNRDIEHFVYSNGGRR